MSAWFHDLAQECIEEWPNRRWQVSVIIDYRPHMSDRFTQRSCRTFLFAVLNERLSCRRQLMEPINLSLSDVGYTGNKLRVRRQWVVFGSVEKEDWHITKSSAFQFTASMFTLYRPSLFHSFDVET